MRTQKKKMHKILMNKATKRINMIGKSWVIWTCYKINTTSNGEHPYNRYALKDKDSYIILANKSNMKLIFCDLFCGFIMC